MALGLLFVAAGLFARSFRPRIDIDVTSSGIRPRERTTLTGRLAFSTFAASTSTAVSARRARRPRRCRGSFRYAKALVENSESSSGSLRYA